ncbi:MAG: ABC transporter ATP-binding protein [Alphaproteobacteria bacterium]|nr:ABC transporter ATP-binding protein [Alphaproteobacteria bacterium]
MKSVAPKDMVRLEACAKRYGVTQALTPTDLAIAEGEFVTLLGPSGSGKTTILNLIAGTIVPSAGRIWIAGRDVTDVAVEKRGLGMVFQNYALMPHMSIFENVAFPLRVRRCPEDEIRRKVAEVLDLVRLPGVADRKPRQLSGGQQQRVSLARCIVYNPPLILMDEPLGALDKKLREQMQLEIRSLHRSLGITMLYVTHDQQEALTMSDRIVLLNGGRIEQTGTPDELYFRPKTVFAADFLGDSSLIAATVEAPGHPTSLVTDGGVRLMGEQSTIVSGTRITAVVRPENVRLGAVGRGRGENSFEGTVIDITVLGSVIRHHVRLGDGNTIVAHEFNRRGKSETKQGDKVMATWHAEDLLILENRS